MRGYVVLFEGDDETGYSAYARTYQGWRLRPTLGRRPRV